MALVLVLSHSFAYRAIWSILMTYLTDNWTYEHFQIAVVITYALNGVFSMMIMVLAHISDKYCMDDHIIMIFSTNVVYVLGLLLLSSSKAVDKNIAIGEIYGSLLLLCVGEAGRCATLYEFIHNQYLSEQNPQEPADYETYTTRRDAFWEVAWGLGALLTFIPGVSNMAIASTVSASAIGFSCLVFWYGRSNYFINNRNSKETETDERGSQLCTDDIRLTPLPPSEGEQNGQACMISSSPDQERDQRRKQNGREDKEVNGNPCQEEEILETATEGKSLSAVEVEEAGVDSEAQETDQRRKQNGREDKEVNGNPCQEEEILEPGRGEVWTIKKVKEKIPFFRKMMLMWVSFIIYSMVDATGHTFFYGQMSNLHTFSNSFALYISSLSSFSKFITPFLYKTLVTPKKWRHATLVRIGCAMVCSVLCSSAAYLVETNRLKLVEDEGIDKYDAITTISMDISCLIPQFVVIGIMRGLAEEGLVDFFKESVTDGDELMIRYKWHITNFVLGITKSISLLTIVVPILLTWFGVTMNMSRVDKYYLVLIIASSVNLCWYFYVAYFYATDKSQQAAAEENEQSA